MDHKDYIRFECEGHFYDSFPLIEQLVKRTMFKNHSPESIVKCWDWTTDELLDELELRDLFNK